MPKKISDEVIAQILAETDYYSDEQVAARWGITDRSIRRYRKRLAEDSVLSGIVLRKRKFLEKEWSVNATAALKSGLIELTRRYSRAATKEEADMIQAIASSLKVVGELKIASDALSDADLEKFP